MLKEKVCILMMFHRIRSYKQHNWYLGDDFWVINLKQKKSVKVEFFITIKVVGHYNPLLGMSYTSKFSICIFLGFVDPIACFLVCC